MDDGAVEPEANRGSFLVEASVIELCRDDVLHCVAWDTGRNQRAHKRTRDGSVAVGKMKNVWLVERLLRYFHAQSRPSRTREIHPLKSRIAESRQVARGNGVYPHAVQPVCLGLQVWKRVGMYLDIFQQVVLVTGLREQNLLVPGGKIRKVIDFRGMKPG